MTIDEYTNEYSRRRLSYERFAEKIKTELEEILNINGLQGQFEARAKDVLSFRNKIIEKRYASPFNQMTDLAGVRIIVNTLDEVDAVAAIIRAEFLVDEEHSINKSAATEADRFGYVSQHLIVRLTVPRVNMTVWQRFEGLTAEIQVRTGLQHTWSAIQHPLGYKHPSSIPPSLKRRLSRVSALLEVADAEFNQIAKEASELRAEYELAIKRGDPSVEINHTSMTAHVRSSETSIHLLIREIEASGASIFEMPLYTSIAEYARLLGCKTIADFESLMAPNKRWLIRVFQEYMEELNDRHFSTPELVYYIMICIPEVLPDLMSSTVTMENERRLVNLAREWRGRASGT